ncbi:MAG: ATP-dependent 26S proteasome regulatory subunit [Alphaproteobacteria bacterium]|jgi:ATP-dependent 26S proteasome regulatory subunit
MNWLKKLLRPDNRIDHKIDKLIDERLKQKFIIHTIDLPAYRFVDLMTAVNAVIEPRGDVTKIETQQHEGLNQIIHDIDTHYDRTMRISPKVSWPTGPDTEEYLPIDTFWVCPAKQAADCLVARLTFNEYAQKTTIEVACGDTDAGKKVLDDIVDESRRNSIYRGHNLNLSYESGKRDEYGDVEKPERFQITFSTIEDVTAEDIVLTDEHLTVLQRNIIDLYTRRDILEENGIPARRGILLHGPPGTGKTFACRFLCHKLEGVTCLFVTGSSLLNVGAIFSFARLLQPAVLFLEDVDLIFATREINLYSTALGDLLDQMDGLRSRENISVVLTTNAIDRLEAAIKDRPGRISQCIYMGAPAPAQRRLFLAHQLQSHNAKAVDVEQLVRDSDGATQAFLKEWTYRAVQIACERLETASEKAELRDDDFSEALNEMRRFLDGSDGKIIGFTQKS